MKRVLGFVRSILPYLAIGAAIVLLGRWSYPASTFCNGLWLGVCLRRCRTG